VRISRLTKSPLPVVATCLDGFLQSRIGGGASSTPDRLGAADVTVPVSGINTPTPLELIATAPATKQITVPSAHTAATVESLSVLMTLPWHRSTRVGPPRVPSLLEAVDLGPIGPRGADCEWAKQRARAEAARRLAMTESLREAQRSTVRLEIPVVRVPDLVSSGMRVGRVSKTGKATGRIDAYLSQSRLSWR
jgi:hypothetical protein